MAAPGLNTAGHQTVLRRYRLPCGNLLLACVAAAACIAGVVVAGTCNATPASAPGTGVLAVSGGVPAVTASRVPATDASGALVPIVATDVRGHVLQLARPARRIVALAPHVTELVFAAGAGDRLVAVAQWSDFPAAAARLPRIGGAGRLDVERIHAYAPDLVIGWQSGGFAADVQALEALGHRVFQTEPRKLADIAPLLRSIGRLAGTEAAAEAEAQRVEQALAALRRPPAGPRRVTHPDANPGANSALNPAANPAANPAVRPVTLFYQIWDAPLMTVSDRHLIGDAIGWCGASNVFGRLRGLSAVVSIEAVLAADPQLIVAAIASQGDDRPLDRWRRFGHLQAVARGQLVRVDPDLLHRPTPRIVDGVRSLCQAVERAQAAR